ncbi:hypothetical protein B566_EDAN010306 [Ephemera danica]|nr:hypothetical protein B566_EDAN010306 [Ephemera danica]
MQQDMVTPVGYEPQPPPTQGAGSAQLQAAGGGAGAGAVQPPPAGEEYGQDQAVFEADKRSVYKHPLFPLLALLFERCEQATQSAEHLNSESFNMDIQAFVQHQERDRKPFLINDPEVDGLMIKAIQVLRIHLLELEKVQELCKDFCNRYITCLKGKMQSENLLRSDYAYDNNNHPGSANNNSSSVSSSPPPGGLQAFPAHPQSYQHHQGAPLLSGSSSSSSVPTSPGIVHGSTPLSQIGATTCAAPPSDSSLVQSEFSSTIGYSLSPAPTTPGSMDDEDDFPGVGGKKPKRGVLPKHATSVMRSWLFQHLVHPYPTEDEKRQIAAQTSLTLLQVNNWFINARRRILQPMLDASNPGDSGVAGTGSSTSAKSKKSKGGGGGGAKQAAQRFWPDSIASLQPQLAGINGGAPASMPQADSLLTSGGNVSSGDEESDDEDESEEGCSDDEEEGSSGEDEKPPRGSPHEPQ